MELTMYQIDAFASELFKGNPAAVCPLQEWLAGDVMQKIANENNLSETAFFVPKGKDYELRWFTPQTEVDLCGHATLATAKIIYDFMNHTEPEIRFFTRSGWLIVRKNGDKLTLDFPTLSVIPIELPDNITDILGGATPKAAYSSKFDLLLEFENANEVRHLKPDFNALHALNFRGIVVTARGDNGDCDFVSRFFAPAAGVNEDPATGSAHCVTAPFWAERLGKNHLFARQLSHRGGELWCEYAQDRVLITGQAVVYMKASIFV